MDWPSLGSAQGRENEAEASTASASIEKPDFCSEVTPFLRAAFAKHIMESFELEEIFKIIEPNHSPSTEPHPQEPHAHI